MARIIFPDGKELKDLPTIQNRLAQLNITLRHWPAPARGPVRGSFPERWPLTTARKWCKSDSKHFVAENALCEKNVLT